MAAPAVPPDAQGSPSSNATHRGEPAGVPDQQVDIGTPPHDPQADPNPLSSYPRCKHLIEVYRALPGAQNKTPLAVLHEYATRLNLEVCKLLSIYELCSVAWSCFYPNPCTGVPKNLVPLCCVLSCSLNKVNI